MENQDRPDLEQLSFKGSFYKFTTTVDGGGRISFEVPQSELHLMYELMESQGKLLKIIVQSERNNY